MREHGWSKLQIRPQLGRNDCPHRQEETLIHPSFIIINSIMSRRHLTPPTLIQPEPEKEGRAGLSTRMTISRDSLVMCRIGNFDDRYVITGKIGEGIFGTVYEVRHKRLRLRRALKVVKKRGSEHFSSLEEVEVLKRLDHPNILKIHEFYEAADSYFIITEVF